MGGGRLLVRGQARHPGIQARCHVPGGGRRSQKHKRKAAVSRKVVERILPPTYKVSRLRESSSDRSVAPKQVRTPQEKRGSQCPRRPEGDTRSLSPGSVALSAARRIEPTRPYSSLRELRKRAALLRFGNRLRWGWVGELNPG